MNDNSMVSQCIIYFTITLLCFMMVLLVTAVVALLTIILQGFLVPLKTALLVIVELIYTTQ